MGQPVEIVADVDVNGLVLSGQPISGAEKFQLIDGHAKLLGRFTHSGLCRTFALLDVAASAAPATAVLAVADQDVVLHHEDYSRRKRFLLVGFVLLRLRTRGAFCGGRIYSKR